MQTIWYKGKDINKMRHLCAGLAEAAKMRISLYVNKDKSECTEVLIFHSIFAHI